MYTNILIPTDGSELAGKAVEHGIALAKQIGAKVPVLTVLPPFHTFTTDTQMIEDTPAMPIVTPSRAAPWMAIAIGAVVFSASAAAATDCEGLAGKNFGDASITAAKSIAPPFNIAGKDPPTPVSVNKPFCRVEGVLKPSVDSDIKFEVWLPPESVWNGKYQGVGNGGFAGSLIYRSMDRSLEAGYAVSGTDTGHSGGPLDAAWALGHPEKIVDFGWRAIHETAAVSKATIEAYYGKPPALSPAPQRTSGQSC